MYRESAGRPREWCAMSGWVSARMVSGREIVIEVAARTIDLGGVDFRRTVAGIVGQARQRRPLIRIGPAGEQALGPAPEELGP